DFSCPDLTPASVLESATAEYPPGAPSAEAAVVIIELTVGVDGRARDPEVLLQQPAAAFAAAAVEGWLNSRFTPATRPGVPIGSRLQAETGFSRGPTLSDSAAYKSARQRADAGDVAAEYLLGLTATLDSSLGIANSRAGQLLVGSARDGEARAQY